MNLRHWLILFCAHLLTACHFAKSSRYIDPITFYRLEKADRLAQQGNCTESIKIEEAVLDSLMQSGRAKSEAAARVMAGITICYRKIGNYVAAQRYINKSIQIFTSLHGEINSDVLNSKSALANTLYLAGDYPLAEKMYAELLKTNQQQAKPDWTKISLGFQKLGDVQLAQGDYGSAEKSYRQALNLSSSQNNTNGKDYINLISSLGELAQFKGDSSRAIKYYEQALALLVSYKPTDPYLLAQAYHRIGKAKFETGKYNDASVWLNKQIAVLESMGLTESPEWSSALASKGELSVYQGKYDDARKLLERAYHADSARPIVNHRTIALRLHSLGLLELDLGDSRSGERLLMRSLAELRKVEIRNNLDTAKIYQSLAMAKSDSNELDNAEYYIMKSLEIKRGILPDRHEGVLAARYILGNIKAQRMDLHVALNIHQSILDFRQDSTSGNDYLISLSLYAIGNIQLLLGNRKAALIRFQSALEKLETHLPHEHLDAAMIEIGVAKAMSALGQRSQALQLYFDALGIQRKLTKKDNITIATTMDAIANNYLELGNLQDADQHYLSALLIKKRTLPPDNIGYLPTLTGMASLLQAQGRLPEARSTLDLALRISREKLGEMNVMTSDLLLQNAILERLEGRNNEAERALWDSIFIYESIDLSKHPKYPIALYYLGVIRKEAGDIVTANLAWRRSIDILRKLESPPLAGQVQADYATLLHEQGRQADAEAYYKEALLAGQRVPEPDPATLRYRLLALAEFYQDEVRYADAEKHYLEAVRFYDRKELIPTNILVQISNVLILQGDKKRKETLSWTTQALKTEMQELSNWVLDLEGNERERRLADWARRTDFLFSSLGKSAAVPADLLEFALNVSIVKRASLLTIDAARADALSTMLSESAQRDRQELMALEREYSTLLTRWTRAAKTDYEFVERKLAEIASKRHSLRKKVYGQLPLHLADVERLAQFGIHDLADRLVDDSIYIDIVQFEIPNRSAVPAERFYRAFMLFPDGNIKHKYLGSAKEIDKLLQALTRMASKGDFGKIKESARKAYDQTFRKLDLDQRIISKIYIASDGEFARSPLHVMRNKNGQYLTEKYQFIQVNSGRDLLAKPTADSQANGIYAVVYPDYDYGPLARTTSVRATSRSRAVSTNEDLRPLPWTRIEGNIIQRHFPNDTKVISGKEATEEAMLALVRPAILHIATHFNFLADAHAAADGRRRGRGGPLSKPTSSPDLHAIALTSANYWPHFFAKHPTAQTLDDGWLVSREFALADLRGTQLVVLAGCESGQGMLRRGQGVFGLRSAAFVAGAETVVTSLWDVNDAVTSEWMDAFYRHLKQGEGRIAAIRQAALEVKRRHPNPHYWAPFVGYGRDEPLRLAR